MTVTAPLTAQKTMSTTAWLLLLLLASMWGSSFIFSKVAVSEIPPLTLVLLRVSLAAVTLHIACLVMRVRLATTLKAWGAYFFMGALNNVLAFSLIFWGQQFIEASLSSILNAATPFFTVLIAGLVLTDERFTLTKIIGLLIGFAGVVLVIGPRHLLGLGDHLLAELAIIGASIAYGFAGVFGRRFAAENPMATATGQLTAASIMMLPLAFFIERPIDLGMPSTPVVVSVLALAIISTALAYLLFFQILKTAGATNTSLVTLLVPVFTVIIAVPLLGDTMGPLKLLGLMVIGIGLMVLDGRLIRYARKRLARA
ncbi:MAG: DMT family transporter [Hyphomicrobiales bacterium]|jgi:drug/metabolite transporter (DMT)-like permease